MPLFGVRVHPRLVAVVQTEDDVADETMRCTGLQQKETDSVTLAHAVLSHQSLLRNIISADT